MDVLHPGKVRFLPVRRHEARAAVTHRGDRRRGERRDPHEPLHGEVRLDRRMAAIAAPEREHVRLGADEDAVALEIGDEALARYVAVEPGVRAGFGGHHRALVHHRHHRQLVTQPDLEVVEVVRRRDLHGAGAELAVDVLVGDDRNLAADRRQAHRAAHEATVALVVGMHGDGGVAEHRLRPRRHDLDRAAAVGERIAQMIQLAVGVGVLDLEVGERGAAARAPVDEIAVAVDQPFLVEPDEHLAHRAREALVHREALARPVARHAETLQLHDDRAARRVAPLPGALDERLAPERLAVDALGGELALDDVLRRDAGVVGAGYPQHVVACHAPPATEHVLQRVVEGVPHVQRPRDVRRRDHHRERRLRGGRLRITRIGAEEIALQPLVVPAALDSMWVVHLVEWHNRSVPRDFWAVKTERAHHAFGRARAG